MLGFTEPMPTHRSVLVSMFLACLAMASQGQSLPAVRAELVEMQKIDQEFRRPGQTNEAAQAAADKVNRKRLKELIASYGWPKISMVGRDGAMAAWLIVQHADDEPEFQNAILEEMLPLVESKEVPTQHYAYLYDRTHKPQRYGTQGACVTNGKWAPREIEEPSMVDQRRASMQLEPLAEYEAMASEHLCTK